jgi:NADPH-dependent curcumin reductase CurA
MALLLPDYADRFFDNVGGKILDTMLTLVKKHGMISVCGAIAGEAA